MNHHSQFHLHVANPGKPMKTLPLTILLSLTAGLAQSAAAGGFPAPVARFTDEHTVCAARIDLGAFVPQAWTDAILEAVPDQREMMAPPLEEFTPVAQGWLDGFRSAGGREIYVLLSLSYIGAEPPILLVAPVATEGNPANLESLLAPIAKELRTESRIIENCIVMAPAGVWNTRETMPLRPASPKLGSALAASENGVLQVAFAPYPAAARVLEEMMPRLPAVLGGDSTTVLSRNLQWANASLQTPPAVGLDVVVQSENAEAAAALRDVCNRSLSALGMVREIRENLPSWPSIHAMLSPATDGDTLRLHLGQEQLTALARELLVPALADVRKRATRIMVLNQLKQIALGLMMYANEHKEQLPQHLADGLPYLGTPDVLLLPQSSAEAPPDLMQQDQAAREAWVDNHTPFVFRLPGTVMKSIKEPVSTILVHQKPETAIDRLVGAAFADGHAELMTTEALAERLK